MKKTLIAAAVALTFAAGPAAATGLLDWGVKGRLDVERSAIAGSNGMTLAGVAGRVRSDRPGYSRAASFAHADTTFHSRSALPCGRCGKVAVTDTDGESNANGEATLRLAPRDPGYAEYEAFGGSGGETRVARQFDLTVKGYAEFPVIGELN